MSNPWETIKLSDYEGHMSSKGVEQLQLLSSMMETQLGEHDIRSVAIFGAAGGTGLEHADTAKLEKIYAVDINSDYLCECKKKFARFGDALVCLTADLSDESVSLPHAQLVVADLLIEYIGCACFAGAVKKVSPDYVSCVIQVDMGNSFVSESPYTSILQAIDCVHRDIDENELTAALSGVGYELCDKVIYDLPNGKAFLRLEYERRGKK